MFEGAALIKAELNEDCGGVFVVCFCEAVGFEFVEGVLVATKSFVRTVCGWVEGPMWEWRGWCGLEMSFGVAEAALNGSGVNGDCFVDSFAGISGDNGVH